jgi:hypothetical protein
MTLFDVQTLRVGGSKKLLSIESRDTWRLNDEAIWVALHDTIDKKFLVTISELYCRISIVITSAIHGCTTEIPPAGLRQEGMDTENSRGRAADPPNRERLICLGSTSRKHSTQSFSWTVLYSTTKKVIEGLDPLVVYYFLQGFSPQLEDVRNNQWDCWWIVITPPPPNPDESATIRLVVVDMMHQGVNLN